MREETWTFTYLGGSVWVVFDQSGNRVGEWSCTEEQMAQKAKDIGLGRGIKVTLIEV